MGMKLVTAPSQAQAGNSDPGTNTGRRGRTRKLNPTTFDLPLPPGPEYLSKWGKTLLPQLYAWAGSIDDPFCANTKMAEEVDVLWERVFPDIVLEEAAKPVVLKVVRAFSSILIVLINRRVFV